MKIAEPAGAPDAAIALCLQALHHWRGVGDPFRSPVAGLAPG
jgi:hypothetical protein